MTWLSNAVRTSGRLAGSAANSIAKASGALEKSALKIPGVGPLFHGTILALEGSIGAPFNIAVGLAKGQRVDRVLMGQLKKQLTAIHEIAPYAQSVISMVPGIGPGVSGALGAGLALASGKRLDQVLIAGIQGAVPGGAFGAAVFKMGKAAAEHKPIGQVLAQAASGVSEALGVHLPESAWTAIGSGLSMAQRLAKGERVDRALADSTLEAAKNIPGLTPQMQKAFDVALKTGVAVGHAKTLQVDLADQIRRAGDTMAKEGQELVDANRVTQAAESLFTTPDGKRGFAIGTFAMVHQVSEHELMSTRESLTGPGRVGFDAAVSLHIGRVTAKPSEIPEDSMAQAGFLMTKGTLGASPEQQAAMTDLVTSDPSAKAGSDGAVYDVLHARLPWTDRLYDSFGLGAVLG